MLVSQYMSTSMRVVRGGPLPPPAPPPKPGWSPNSGSWPLASRWAWRPTRTPAVVPMGTATRTKLRSQSMVGGSGASTDGYAGGVVICQRTGNPRKKRQRLESRIDQARGRRRETRDSERRTRTRKNIRERVKVGSDDGKASVGRDDGGG